MALVRIAQSPLFLFKENDDLGIWTTANFIEVFLFAFPLSNLFSSYSYSFVPSSLLRVHFKVLKNINIYWLVTLVY
jgi:hypothetical protein